MLKLAENRTVSKLSKREMGANDFFASTEEQFVATSNIKPNTNNETIRNKVQVKRKYPCSNSPKQKAKPLITRGVPSAASQVMYRKWQLAADEMGSGQKIVVDKVQAKQLVFDWLHDQFKPRTITDIYKALKATVPSLILKHCLDEMTCITYCNDDDKQASCDHSAEVGDSALYSIAGRASTSTLYYVNYSKLSNNGNGLPLGCQKKLEADLYGATALSDDLLLTEASILSKCRKLLLEPTNESADMLVEKYQSDGISLLAKVAYYRALADNEKKRKHTLTKINWFLLHWKRRRKICVDFLTMLEEFTDGSINLKKCLAGAGQVEIESDECVAKEAWETALNKQASHTIGDLSGPSIPKCLNAEVRRKLVSVNLLPNGTINRKYFPA